jgi:hypothetical protein
VNRDRSAWKKKCRCGSSLSYSCEDIKTGQPAPGADYWCSSGDPAKGPHDWGVVMYENSDPVYHGPEGL